MRSPRRNAIRPHFESYWALQLNLRSLRRLRTKSTQVQPFRSDWLVECSPKTARAKAHVRCYSSMRRRKRDTWPARAYRVAAREHDDYLEPGGGDHASGLGGWMRRGHSIAEQYSRQLRRRFRMWPTWLPDGDVRVGDFGRIENGLFERQGRLDGALSGLAARRTRSTADQLFASDGGRQVAVGAAGASVDAPDAKAAARIEFGRELGILVALDRKSTRLNS